MTDTILPSRRARTSKSNLYTIDPLSDIIAAEESLSSETEHKSVEITRCPCHRKNNRGLMICCEICQCWQHADCMGLPEIIPLEYFCEVCKPEGHSYFDKLMAMEEELVGSSRKSSRVVSTSVPSLRRGTMNSSTDWSPQLIEKLFGEPLSDASVSSPPLPNGLPTPDTIDSHDEIQAHSSDEERHEPKDYLPTVKPGRGGKRKVAKENAEEEILLESGIVKKKPKKEPKKLAYKKVSKVKKVGGTSFYGQAKKNLSTPPLTILDTHSLSEVDDTIANEPIPTDPEVYGHAPLAPCRPMLVSTKATINSMIKRNMNIRECMAKMECNFQLTNERTELADSYETIRLRLVEKINAFLEEYES